MMVRKVLSSLIGANVYYYWYLGCALDIGEE